MATALSLRIPPPLETFAPSPPSNAFREYSGPIHDPQSLAVGATSAGRSGKAVPPNALGEKVRYDLIIMYLMEFLSRPRDFHTRLSMCGR